MAEPKRPGLPLAELVGRDLRFGWRQLCKSPVFTAAVVLTLALGIGANTAMFTLVNGILLRTLPVAQPGQLYRIGDTGNCCVDGGFVGDNGDFDIYSYDLYLHLQAAAPEFFSLAAVQAGQGTYAVRRGEAPAKSLPGEYVSGNYFTTLGVGAALGRPLLASDDQPGAPLAAVLSYNAWKDEYASDPGIVGATVTIQTHPFTIIGVAPAGFYGDRVSDTPPEFWMPLAAEPRLDSQAMGNGATLLQMPDSHWLYPIGRVRPGTNIATLQAKLSAALRTWLWSRPRYTQNGGAAIIPRQHVVVVPGGGGIQRLQLEVGKGLKTVMLLSLVVLMMACANIANMLLARGTARRGEIAVRMALGATRAGITRAIVIESVLLSCCGGLAGLAVAYAGSRTLLALAFPDARNSSIPATPSPAVLAFAVAITLLTGVLFGLAPAWLATHAQPAEALRGANRATRDRTSLPQTALVVLQAMLAVVLLAGALLMSQSLRNLEHQPLGVATANRYVVHFDPNGAGYTLGRLPALYRRVEDGLGGLPAVANVGLALYSPLEGDNWGECVIPEGHAAPGPNTPCGSTWDRVSPGFLDAIGVPMVRGRNFTADDTAASSPVAVVNEAFARKFFPNQDPIGRRFGLDLPRNSGAFEIVGVFRDFKMNNPRSPVRAVFLRPLSQYYSGYNDANMSAVEAASMYVNAIVVDFRHPPPAAEAAIRQSMAAIDPNLTVQDLRSFDTQVAGNFSEDRLIAGLTSLFGLLALVLASIGLYGVTAYLVARRAGEIGIRMALGASRAGVVGLVLRGALAQIALGLALGIPAAVLTGRLLATQLYGVGPNHIWALGGATAVLAICSALAALIPASRAAGVDPMHTLRAE